MKKVGKKFTVALGIICVLLAAGLFEAIANYTSTITSKDNIIAEKDSTINNQNSTLTSLNTQIAKLNETNSLLNIQIANDDLQIENLTSHNLVDDAKINVLTSQIDLANDQTNYSNSEIAKLEKQVDALTAITNMSQSEKLKTVIFHVSEKGEAYAWGHLPEVNYTFNQILSLTNKAYNVLLRPEYKGNQNWAEELEWLRDNFGGQHGIPIMLDVFSGGNLSTPVQKLTTTDISAAMAVSNVQWLAINEIASWHIEQNQTFPVGYVSAILDFAHAHNLKVFWTEWKIDTFTKIKSYISGWEDMVTVSFSTNSGDLEPAVGFMQINNMFQHWGGSIQAWYWATRYNSEPTEMPISPLVQHALSAKQIGAEVLQFEPYWYFFDNGEVTENLRLLETMLS